MDYQRKRKEKREKQWEWRSSEAGQGKLGCSSYSGMQGFFFWSLRVSSEMLMELLYLNRPMIPKWNPLSLDSSSLYPLSDLCYPPQNTNPLLSCRRLIQCPYNLVPHLQTGHLELGPKAKPNLRTTPKINLRPKPILTSYGPNLGIQFWANQTSTRRVPFSGSLFLKKKVDQTERQRKRIPH